MYMCMCMYMDMYMCMYMCMVCAAPSRWQSVYRTVRGMTKPRRALRLLLEAEVPGATPEQLEQLLDARCRCVWAYQTYADLDQAGASIHTSTHTSIHT